jgi:hypothetical protein
MSTEAPIFALMLIDHAAIVGDADGAHMVILRERVILPDSGTTWMERYSLVRANPDELRAIKGMASEAETPPDPMPGVVTAQSYVPFAALNTYQGEDDALATLRKQAYQAAGRCTMEVLDRVSWSGGVAALVGERWSHELDMRLVVLTHERFDMLVNGSLVLHDLCPEESKAHEEPLFSCEIQRKDALENLRQHSDWLHASSEAVRAALTCALDAQRMAADPQTRKRI